MTVAILDMCVLHVTCDALCSGRRRAPWISPALLEPVEPWSDVLAQNLATGAALCESYERGWDAAAGLASFGVCTRTTWRPGCGRSAS